MLDSVYDETKHKMDITLAHLGKELAGVRTGRASTGLLDGITIDYYGTQTPLAQVANMSTPDAMTIGIQPWDVSLLQAIEKAIMMSDLGLTPSNDGKIIRIGIPPLTEERRRDLTRHVRKISEDAKIALRNVRREGIERIKKMEKDKELSSDDAKKGNDQIQKIINGYITNVEKMTTEKEKEIMDQ